MKFIPVDINDEDHIGFLYRLLSERTKNQSISHKAMPVYTEHRSFVRSRPYQMWSLLYVDEIGWIGSIYLTHNSEVGIFILNEFQGGGYGKEAINMLRDMRFGSIFANVNPANDVSRKMFEKLGGKLIQVTYELEKPDATTQGKVQEGNP